MPTAQSATSIAESLLPASWGPSADEPPLFLPKVQLT
jgi:hypothetical protein